MNIANKIFDKADFGFSGSSTMDMGGGQLLGSGDFIETYVSTHLMTIWPIKILNGDINNPRRIYPKSQTTIKKY